MGTTRKDNVGDDPGATFIAKHWEVSSLPLIIPNVEKEAAVDYVCAGSEMNLAT
jgi:hypothetical protein